MFRFLLIQIICIAMFSVSSFGDVLFEMENMNKDNGQHDKTSVEVKNNKMKMDFYKGGNKLENSMIYRGDSDEMIFLDHKDHSYMVMDKETMDKISKKLNSAMAQFEEAMKNVPPEQREMMKKMMKDKMPGMDNTPYVEPVLKKAGSGSVNGYSCTKYDVYKGNEKIRQHCITNWSDIKGGKEISSVMLEMSGFMDEMAKTFSSNSGPMGNTVKFERNVFNQLKEMNGFPVKTIEYDNGKVESESVLKSSTEKTISSSEFEVPQKYKRQNINFE